MNIAYAGRDAPSLRHWTAHDDAELLAWVCTGKPASAATVTLGRSRNALIARAARLGTPFHSRASRPRCPHCGGKIRPAVESSALRSVRPGADNHAEAGESA